MERYEKYKDSGIEWIGEIPEHWKLKRIKQLVTEVESIFIDGDWIESKDIVFDTDYIRYITTGNIGEGKYKEQGSGYITEETFLKLNCTEVFPGDLLISRLNPPIGRACIVPELGKRIVTSVDNVILRPDKRFLKRFLVHFFSNHRYFEYTLLEGRGATMQRISRSILGNIKIVIPPLPEQTAIAAYLDRKTSEIDALIAKKKRLLELYEEEKTAIINHAVTKGINPNAPMKDSGIDWLGEVPESWIGTKLKFVSEKIGDGIHTTPKYVKNSEYKFVNGNNLDNGSIKYYDSTRSVSKEEYEELKKDIKEGTVLISINGTVGKLAFFANEKVILGKSAAYIEPKADLFNKFLFYIFQTHYVKTQFDLSYSGSTINNLSLYTLHNLDIVLPNKVEQEDIVLHLEADLKEYDNNIIRVKKLIDLLNEYRTTLINEVVTGRNKVT
ncbi:MAG: restriction endonuclease subunit S [Candidatus Cloacimonadales bacterium]|nr:restriction endonuclease subunit S [Bacteroidales bacterium]MDD3962257.1 restriction endonuclease subunit S [Bacteroidales bacterium]